MRWAPIILVCTLSGSVIAAPTRYQMHLVWVNRSYPIMDGGSLGPNGTVIGTMLIARRKQRLVTIEASGSVAVHVSPYDLTTEGYFVNRYGVVAGSAELPGESYSAAIWKEGKYIELGWIGGRYSWSSGINDLGWVTGHTSTGHGERAFLWREGTMREIPRMTSNPDLEVRGVTNWGEVYGNESNYDGGYQHTFVWTEAGGIHPLFPESAFVRDMNNRGQAVGRVIRKQRAAVLVGGTVRVLDGNWAYAINDQGTIVGRARGGTEIGDALVWFDLSKRYRLDDLVDNLGALRIEEAMDIDNDGRILVLIRDLPQGTSGLAVLTPTNRPDLLFLRP